jgi:hypothetical protein
LLERAIQRNRVSGNGGALQRRQQRRHANPQPSSSPATTPAPTAAPCSTTAGGPEQPGADRSVSAATAQLRRRAIYNDAINSGTTRALISNTTFSTNNASTKARIYHYVGSNGNGR